MGPKTQLHLCVFLFFSSHKSSFAAMMKRLCSAGAPADAAAAVASWIDGCIAADAVDLEGAPSKVLPTFSQGTQRPQACFVTPT